MCTYNITLNDKLVEKVRPAFADDMALQQWMQEQVAAALEHFLENIKSEQHMMVSESLTSAYAELKTWQSHPDARHLFRVPGYHPFEEFAEALESAVERKL